MKNGKFLALTAIAHDLAEFAQFLQRLAHDD
jgi:hypothetical protein